MHKHSLFFATWACLCAGAQVWAQPPGLPLGGGFPPFTPPRPGEILPGFIQDSLKLTDAQKKQIEKWQKQLDANLDKLLTAEQKKSLDELRKGNGLGGFGPPGFGPGGGGPGQMPPGGFPGGLPGGFPGGGPGKGKGGPGGAGGAPPGGFPGGPPGGGGPGGFGKKGGFGGGFGGGISVADVQKKVGATDEQWKVIGPKLQKVVAARRVWSGSDSSGPQASNIVAQAQADLRSVLDDPKHTKSEVDEKLGAIRKARQQARAELEEASRDLSRLLTPSQQTIMISLGYLE